MSDLRERVARPQFETTTNDIRWFSQNVPPGLKPEQDAIDRLVRDHKRIVSYFCAIDAAIAAGVGADNGVDVLPLTIANAVSAAWRLAAAGVKAPVVSTAEDGEIIFRWSDPPNASACFLDDGHMVAFAHHDGKTAKIDDRYFSEMQLLELVALLAPTPPAPPETGEANK